VSETERTSWTRPDTFRPNQFIVYAVPTITRNVASSVTRPPPTTSETYPPVKATATGAPSGTAK
jgi:hypothetical protein